MDVFFEIRKIKIFIMLPLHIRTSSRGARRGGEGKERKGREGRGDRWGEVSKSEFWNSREQRLSYEWVSKGGVREE